MDKGWNERLMKRESLLCFHLLQAEIRLEKSQWKDDFTLISHASLNPARCPFNTHTYNHVPTHECTHTSIRSSCLHSVPQGRPTMHCCKLRESTLTNKQAERQDRRWWTEFPVCVFAISFLFQLCLINTTAYQQGE